MNGVAASRSSAPTAELQIASVSLADAGSYTCTITNAHGDVSTTPAVVTVNPPLGVTTLTLPAGTAGCAFQRLARSHRRHFRTHLDVESGLLPPGLTLSSSGSITGTRRCPPALISSPA